MVQVLSRVDTSDLTEKMDNRATSNNNDNSSILSWNDHSSGPGPLVTDETSDVWKSTATITPIAGHTTSIPESNIVNNNLSMTVTDNAHTNTNNTLLLLQQVFSSSNATNPNLTVTGNEHTDRNNTLLLLQEVFSSGNAVTNSTDTDTNSTLLLLQQAFSGSNATNVTEPILPPVTLFSGILRFGLSALIIVVNVLTILTFCRVRALRTLSNMLTMSLAVTDLGVGLIVFVSAFNLIPALNPIMTFSAETCMFRLCWFFVCCCTSMMTIMLTAGERYLFIVHPYKHIEYINSKVMGSLIAVSWVAGFLYGLTPLSKYRFDPYVRCDMFYVIGPDHVVYGGGGIFLITSIVTLVFYSLIARLVMEKRRSVVVPKPTCSDTSTTSQASLSPDGDHRHASLRAKLLALKAPVVVFGAFFVSWAPHMTVYALYDAGLIDVDRASRVWVTNFGLFNSAMNFFVYLVLNRQFRQALSVRSLMNYCCPWVVAPKKKARRAWGSSSMACSVVRAGNLHTALGMPGAEDNEAFTPDSFATPISVDAAAAPDMTKNNTPVEAPTFANNSVTAGCTSLVRESNASYADGGTIFSVLAEIEIERDCIMANLPDVVVPTTSTTINHTDDPALVAANGVLLTLQGKDDNEGDMRKADDKNTNPPVVCNGHSNGIVKKFPTVIFDDVDDILKYPTVISNQNQKTREDYYHHTISVPTCVQRRDPGDENSTKIHPFVISHADL